MKRNMKQLFISAISVVMIMSLMTSMVSAVEESTYGTAGVITEAPRNPEDGDSSNWLTIQSEEAGTRMVTISSSNSPALLPFKSRVKLSPSC